MLEKKIATYITVSVVAGIVFAIMDGLINANSIAEELYAYSLPIRRTSVDIVTGTLIDIAYGFILAGLFLVLYKGLPGRAGLVKGLGFGVFVWFLRVAMNAASQWVMLNVPSVSLLYTLVTGFAEMLVLGILLGVALNPSR